MEIEKQFTNVHMIQTPLDVTTVAIPCQFSKPPSLKQLTSQNFKVGGIPTRGEGRNSVFCPYEELSGDGTPSLGPVVASIYKAVPLLCGSLH